MAVYVVVVIVVPTTACILYMIPHAWASLFQKARRRTTNMSQVSGVGV